MATKSGSGKSSAGKKARKGKGARAESDAHERSRKAGSLGVAISATIRMPTRATGRVVGRSSGARAHAGGDAARSLPPAELLLRRFQMEIEQRVRRLPSHDVQAMLMRPSALEGLAVLVADSAAAPAAPHPLVAALLRGRDARQALLARVTTLTVPETAHLLGVTDQAVHKRIARGAVLALRDGADWRVPAWQFDPKTHALREGVADLIQAAAQAALDAWDLQAFLSDPLYVAEGETTALAWFDAGRVDEVVRLLAAHGTHAA